MVSEEIAKAIANMPAYIGRGLYAHSKNGQVLLNYGAKFDRLGMKVYSKASCNVTGIEVQAVHDKINEWISIRL